MATGHHHHETRHCCAPAPETNVQLADCSSCGWRCYFDLNAPPHVCHVCAYSDDESVAKWREYACAHGYGRPESECDCMKEALECVAKLIAKCCCKHRPQ